MAVVSIKDLLDAGVHFGHQTRRWNPKMKRFLHGERNGIYIIDLHQTLQLLSEAYEFVRDLVADGGTVLFVGTKKQAQDSVQSYAERSNMPYINERWLGGMLTNYETMGKRVAKMKEYQRMRDSGEFEAMPKKEALLINRELTKLEKNLFGIRNMEKLPQAVFILDTKKESIAVTEANKLKIPIIAVVDTNCDPDLVKYVIPGNDDAIRSGDLMARIISEAVIEGRFIASKKNPPVADDGKPAPAAPAPLTPEQQAAKAAAQAEARDAAATAAAQRDARVAAGEAPAPVAAAPEAAPAEAAPAPAEAPAEPAPEAAAPEMTDAEKATAEAIARAEAAQAEAIAKAKAAADAAAGTPES